MGLKQLKKNIVSLCILSKKYTAYSLAGILLV
jgi:hypothetical protein